MLSSLKYFERMIAWIMAALIALVILLATVDLGINLFRDIFLSAPRFLIDVDELLDIFGQFLIILVGFELLEIVKAYMRDDAVHVEVVLIVALIALARKVIVIEATAVSGSTMMGIGVLMLSIAASYWLVTQVLRAARDRAA